MERNTNDSNSTVRAVVDSEISALSRLVLGQKSNKKKKKAAPAKLYKKPSLYSNLAFNQKYNPNPGFTKKFTNIPNFSSTSRTFNSGFLYKIYIDKIKIKNNFLKGFPSKPWIATVILMIQIEILALKILIKIIML